MVSQACLEQQSTRCRFGLSKNENTPELDAPGCYICGRRDLNSHRIKLPLEPESSASAIPPLPLDKWYSTIRGLVCKPLIFCFYKERKAVSARETTLPVLWAEAEEKNYDTL